MSGGESRGRRRHEEHEEHEEHVNHEAWVIPYADVLTLLMALFLVLWALGDTNDEKTEIAAESFRRELGGGAGPGIDVGIGNGGGPLAAGGISILEGAGPALQPSGDGGDAAADAAGVDADESGMGDDDAGVLSGVSPNDISPDDPRFEPLEDPMFDSNGSPVVAVDNRTGNVDDAEDLADPLDDIERAVREEAEGSGLSTSVGFRREARGLVVSIVSDSVLFGEGAADVQLGGITILDVVADALADRANPIIVEGHTDSRPISTAEFPSNWELSTARATSVLRFLSEDRGLDAGRLSAAGYADTRPLTDGEDPASLARNRRVEIVVIG
ncbi:MAG: flagellar motor protein MotB [Ilumatobacter sp.]